MKNLKISEKRLREIVIEEFKASRQQTQVQEAVDHAGISAVVAAASKLMAAIDAFKQKAAPAAINALTPGLGQLEKTLEDMVSTPGSYVAKPKVEPKKVSLRAVKGEGVKKKI